MKRFLIIISLLIAPSMNGQYYEHYSYYMPIIDESIQYLKDNISEDTYNKVRDYLIITESGQIYENPYSEKTIVTNYLIYCLLKMKKASLRRDLMKKYSND